MILLLFILSGANLFREQQAGISGLLFSGIQDIMIPFRQSLVSFVRMRSKHCSQNTERHGSVQSTWSCTGDIVWTGRDINRLENEYFSKIANLSCSLPFMVAIGNHEPESAFYFDY
jgi:hypothetical protein